MHADLLVSLTAVLVLGMLAQWIAWRLKHPSIVYLLGFGLAVGPIAAGFLGHPLLDVDHFMGELLFPVISASVAVILFEGGMSLRFSEIQGSAPVVRLLITVGVLVTAVIRTLAARWMLGMDWGVALVLGATLVVTGPTVIIPLLKQIRPRGRVGSILRWEGIIIDPVGAILAVLVFEEIIVEPSLLNGAWILVKTGIIGLALGYGTARLMIELYRRYWVPDSLQNPLTLGFVIAAFALSNVVQAESGLVTVTVMGMAMVNQRLFDVRHIIEFKETLQVLLLSSLFILLSARITPADLAQIGLPTLGFVALIVLVERPLAVFFSTIGSGLNWREKLFLAWMAPRGIVAASVASIFALELEQRGIDGAEQMVPVTFAVIIGTVAIYSITAGPLARRMGLAESNPQGLLIVGANLWIRRMAKLVQESGFRVVLADTNQTNVDRARHDGLEVYHGNILSEAVEEEVDFAGLGRLLALTPNAEVNALADEQFQGMFGSANVFQLQNATDGQERDSLARHLGGRRLFTGHATYDSIVERYRSGARMQRFVVRKAQRVQESVPDAILPLFVLPGDERLIIWSEDETHRLHE
ncbi:MAG: sodium:proton antiporter, partial [Anaerolineae bacterium]|nr:sodium:proton antiporter [Anaerolineae bacterium]